MPPLVVQLVEVAVFDFAKVKVDVETLLSNSSKLAKFDPSAATDNALSLTVDGHIQVINKEEGVEEITKLVGMLSFDLEYRQFFATEKQILIWHFSQLLPYLEQRWLHLKRLPIDTLRQYHDNSMQLQGFYQLCKNLSSQLSAFNHIIAQSENHHRQDWSSRFSLVQHGLSNKLKEIVDEAIHFIEKIKKERKEKLTIDTPNMNLLAIGPFIVAQPVVRPIPREYSLGIVKINEIRYEAKAYFQTFRDTWLNPEKYQFTGKLRFRIFQGAQDIHASVLIYPSWNLSPPTETTETELNTVSVHNKLRTLYKDHPCGSIKFEALTLHANFIDIHTHVTANEILPYCATLVDIAKSHNMQEVTIFAPYEYSAVMFAFGFYSQRNDAHAPNREQQLNQVEHAHTAGIETPLLPIYNRQVAGTGEKLLRPFSFNLDEIGKRPVYITESRIQTTYANILTKSTITQHDDCENGLLPEFLQIPNRFTGVFFSIREREITGRLRRPAVTYGMSPVQYETLNKDHELQDYAFTDPDASKHCKHRQMLTLKRKMI